MGERLCWSDGMGWDEQTESVYSLQYLKCLERCRRDQGCLDQTSPVMVGDQNLIWSAMVKDTVYSHSPLLSYPALPQTGEREREMFPLFA